MFETTLINELFEECRPTLVNSLMHINNLAFEEAMLSLEELKKSIALSVEDVPETPEKVLNEQYVLKRVIDLLLNYASYWKNITCNEFSGSWVTLQNCLDFLRLIKKFVFNKDTRFVHFFENQFIELEKLYPYNIFFSTGITVELFECSICGHDIDSFECDHLKGQIYRGKVAYGIARNITQCDHIAMVSHPADKRCVVAYQNDGPQFHAVRYLSGLITDKVFAPLNFHHLDFKKIKVKNPDVVSQERNDSCACGSGEKFKKCCIDKQFIEKDHVDIIGKFIEIETIIA